MTMMHPASAFGPHGRPDKRTQRQSRLLQATLSTPRFGRFAATIRNISLHGLGGRAPVMLFPGDTVQVELQGLPVMHGIVRWAFDDRFGIETDMPIQLAALRTALGGYLPTSDTSIAFRIEPPVACETRRPGLSIGTPNPGDRTKSDWITE